MMEIESDFAEDHLVFCFALSSYSDIAITFFSQSQTTLHSLDLFPLVPHVELQLRFSLRIQHHSPRRRCPRRALALSLKEDSNPRAAAEREREREAFTLSLPRRQLTVCVETFVPVTLVRQREAKRDATAEWIEEGQKEVSVKRGRRRYYRERISAIFVRLSVRAQEGERKRERGGVNVHIRIYVCIC